MSSLLRKPVLKPIVGLNYMDPSTMLDDRAGFPKNIRLSRNDLKKREGKTAYGEFEIPGGQVMHLCQYPLESLTIRLIRCSKTNIQKLNTNTTTWEDFSGVVFTGGDDDFFSTTVAENKLIISNYVDAMRTYNDAGFATALVASSGTCPKAKFIEYNGGYLIAAYLDDGGTVYPTKLKWTDIGNINAWGSGNYGSSLLYHDPLPIRGLKNLNEFTVCYKKDSIYLGRKVDTSDIFIWDLFYTGVGLAANRAIVDRNGQHYFMGTDDFYLFNGIRPQSIANQTVQREVFSRLDAANAGRCFALLMIEYDEVWFFIVTSGNSWPTEIWKFNYRTSFWYMDTCSAMSAACIYYSQGSISWDELIGTWDQQTWRWDDKLTTTNTPLAIFGNTSGFTLKQNPLTNNDSGSAVDGIWESIDFVADKFEDYKRWLQLDAELKGNNVEVSYSTDFGDTWTAIKTQALTNAWVQYRFYFDIVARQIRFRFRNNTLGETFYLRAFSPFFLYREEVNK